MTAVHPARVVAKALAIFLILNLVYAELEPPVGRLSIYNWLVGGRERFPRGGRGARYDIAPEDLDAAFAVHVISAEKKSPLEYRVVVLGDSAAWGPFLSQSENFVGQLNQAHLSVCGKAARFFNLSYPGPDVLKDFVILNRSQDYAPDMVVWMLTRASVERKSPPPAWGSESAASVAALLHQYGLDRYQRRYLNPPPTFWERGFVAQRSHLARLVLLQAYGLLWAATGIDESHRGYVPVVEHLDPLPSPAADQQIGSKDPLSAGFAFDVLIAADRMLGKVPMLLVNEPIYRAISRIPDEPPDAEDVGPMYDEYRIELRDLAADRGWAYIDLADLVAPSEFTNTVLHVNANGHRQVAQQLSRQIVSMTCP